MWYSVVITELIFIYATTVVVFVLMPSDTIVIDQ